MTVRVLVVGMNAFDSGKTHLALQVMRATTSHGIRAEYFKPVSGHNLWYRHDHTLRCVEEGLPFSYDASVVRGEFSSEVPVAVANPVHRITAPHLLDTPSRVPPTTLSIAGWESTFVLERITEARDGGYHSWVLLADGLLESGGVLADHDVVTGLVRGAEVVPVASMEEVMEFEAGHLDTAVERSFHVVERAADVVVIESFGDSAWPWEHLDRADHVLAVGPGHLFVLDPERFRRAVDVLHHGPGPVRALTCSKACEYVRPIERVLLRPGQPLPGPVIDMLLGGDTQERVIRPV